MTVSGLPDPARGGGARAGTAGPSRTVLVVAGVAVLAFGVTAYFTFGAAGTAGPPRQQAHAWVTATGLGAALGLLVADDRTIGRTVAGRRGSGAVHADCALLVVDAQAANGSLPAPDQQLTTLLSAAYGKEDSAGGDCYAAGATNRPLLARSAAERAAGLALIDRAVQRVRALTGDRVPLATTTAPGG